MAWCVKPASRPTPDKSAGIAARVSGSAGPGVRGVPAAVAAAGAGLGPDCGRDVAASVGPPALDAARAADRERRRAVDSSRINGAAKSP